jgi:hypothetical protein
MKHFLYVLLVALTSASPASAQGTIIGPGQQVLCIKVAAINAVSATTTQLINNTSTTQSIFICGWHVTSILSTSTTFQFTQGTGGTCAGGTSSIISPPLNVTSTAPSADHIDYATVSLLPGNSLCVVTGTGTTGTGVLVYYNQF